MDKLADSCLDKLKPGESYFVLRAQDLTSDSLVRLWAECQRFIATKMKEGATQEEALADMRVRIMTVFPASSLGLLPREGTKVCGAYDIADTMQAWPTRKLAD